MIEFLLGAGVCAAIILFNVAFLIYYWNKEK